MKGVKKDASVLWKPNSRIYTKEFAKRFPELEEADAMKEVKKKDIENDGFIWTWTNQMKINLKWD